MPEHPVAGSQERLTAIHSALAAQKLDVAVDLAKRELAGGGRASLAFNLAAHSHQVEGRFEEAMALLEDGLRTAPEDVFLLCALAGCLTQQGQERPALELYRRVLAFAPEHAPAHHGAGLALSALDEAEAAYAAHLRAVDLAPDFPEALGALSDHAVRREHMDEAKRYAERALALDPDEPAATLSLAFAELQCGAVHEAAVRLERRLARPGLSPLHLAALEGLYADTLDRLERPDASMQAHARSNAATWAVHAPLIAAAGVELGEAMCRRLGAKFQSATPADWAQAPGEPEAGGPLVHVILMGFVRSGTTLLEQVLASHPDVVALEEQPLLRAIAKPWFETDADIDRLSHLDEASAQLLRRDYWGRVRSHGVEPAGRFFVDKNPLDAIWLPLVAKLFPQARVLIAHRDPRDVVVSSFRHRFKLNVLTCAFTDLERTARFYDALMELTQLYRLRLPLHVHVHRHEDLVADFDAQVSAICAFLGLGWTDALRDFAATAKRRDIRTPSKDQVRQGLSSAGVGRWRRYAEAMTPVLPILEPWIDAFGYAP